MTIYIAPTEDMMFLFNELLDNKHFNEIDEYKEINSELVIVTLELMVLIFQVLD